VEGTLWGLWPREPPAGPEAVLRFETSGGRSLVLASNLPYELWLDGVFVGDGGHRCVVGEALADSWPEAARAQRVVVRVHSMRPDSGVSFRIPFEDAFLADVGDQLGWTCRMEQTLHFGGRASAYLPRQTIVTGAPAGPELVLERRELAGWRAVPTPLLRCRHERVQPALTATGAVRGGLPTAEAVVGGDLVDVLRDGDEPLAVATYDLGGIALHRFEVDAPDSSPVLLVHSEAPAFDDAWSTPGRDRAHLADLVGAGVRRAAPFGHRGCRYVHVIVRAGSTPPEPRVHRRDYPLRWREARHDPRDVAIVAACRANLRAIVDGGITDTCWRERVQCRVPERA
jgi:hypothetical protein